MRRIFSGLFDHSLLFANKDVQCQYFYGNMSDSFSFKIYFKKELHVADYSFQRNMI